MTGKYKLIVSISYILINLSISSCGSDQQSENYEKTVGTSSDRQWTSPPPVLPSNQGQPQEDAKEWVAIDTSEESTSTFSIDVDTASYSLARQAINNGRSPLVSKVRAEEFINYFSYDYPSPEGDDPFAVHTELGNSPMNPEKSYLKIGIKAKDIELQERPDSNLVFLVDVSGSMAATGKLDLIKTGLQLLAENLGERDRVAIVVYAGASGVALPSTPGTNILDIMQAIEDLSAGGSTNGYEGIKLAYNIASENFIEGGVNRVILATDGDFNVGITSQEQLVSYVKERASSGIDLSILGVGMHNTSDATLEAITGEGNGQYAYLDTNSEARKIFIEQLSGTLVTVAKDVKIQVVFNQDTVESYRLIGYDNRKLANEDFADDKKDAGDIGAGHTVTAIYEVQLKPEAVAGKIMDLSLRYKKPGDPESTLIEHPGGFIEDLAQEPSADFKFSTAVAAFALKLQGTKELEPFSYQDIAQWAKEGMSADPYGYRAECIELIEKMHSWQQASDSNQPFF